jgi:polygalacturonase
MKIVFRLSFVIGSVLFLSGCASWSDRREMDAILKRIVAPTFPARDFAVTDFGAVGDGRTDAHAAFAGAIEACASAGGGRVVVPAGIFFCNGPIHLKSNVNLHVSEGATIRFSAEPDAYLPAVLTRFEGTLLYGHSPRIYARGQTNIAITGRGTIDGNARETLALMTSAKGKGNAGDLRKMGAEGVPVEQRVFGAGHWLRPSMIQPFECTNVLIEGVTIIDSTFWIVHPVLCRNVTVRGLKIDSNNANNDGCDPDSSADVLIENCDFHTGDDSIAIKSGRDQDGWKVGRPSENIVIRNCLMRSRHSALCVGSEMSGGVRNVFMEDCRLTDVSSVFYFKANLDRGGLVEHVRARRITAESAREGVVRFETSYHGYRGGNFPPSFRDFVIEDVTCARSAAYGIYVEGVSAAPIRDVTVRRVTVESAKEPLWLRHAEKLQLEHVKINGAELPDSPPPTPDGATKLEISS